MLVNLPCRMRNNEVYYNCSTKKEGGYMSSVLQVRIDEKLRKEAEEILYNLGLNMSSAVRLFLNRVVLEQDKEEEEVKPFDLTDNRIMKI